MSHHSEEFDPEMTEHLLMVGNAESDETMEKLIAKFNQRISEDLKAEAKETPRPGPTGNFPHGKLTEKDKGEMFLSLTIKDNAVVLAFGKEVTWIGFTGNQAIDLGKALLKKGRSVNRTRAQEATNEKAV